MKSPVQISLAANGTTAWLPMNVFQDPFSVTLAVFFDELANLTAEAQITPDDLGNQRSVDGASQTTTTITVTDKGVDGNGHGLLAGDSVQLLGTGNNTVDGLYNVATTPTINTYTLTSVTSQSLSLPFLKVVTARVFSHTVLTALTARQFSNLGYPFKGVRLHITNYVAGRAWLEVLQGGMAS